MAWSKPLQRTGGPPKKRTTTTATREEEVEDKDERGKKEETKERTGMVVVVVMRLVYIQLVSRGQECVASGSPTLSRSSRSLYREMSQG